MWLDLGIANSLFFFSISILEFRISKIKSVPPAPFVFIHGMTCTVCITSKKIPACIGTLTIGLVTPSTNLRVWIYNYTTDHLAHVDVTSDSDGLLTADLSAFTFMPSSHYELMLSPAAAFPDEKVSFVLSGEDSGIDCITLEFFRDGESYDSATLIRA